MTRECIVHGPKGKILSWQVYQLLNSFYNKIKYNQFTLIVNKRIDYLIILLLCIEKDMYFNRQRTDLKMEVNKKVKEVSDKTKERTYSSVILR